MLSISHEKLTLSNGLEVVLHEDHSLPSVAVNVWYHVGSKNEEVGRTGFAHLFEHLMFEGSKHHNRDYFEPLQKAGGTINGSTTSDRTNYWENVPSAYLEMALWLEADRMGFLLDALDQKRFDIQRDVVKNERRQSYENRPYGLAHLLLQPTLFPSPHPYSWPTIGSQEDLDAALLDDAKDFFRLHYTPSNASLAIAGDFESAEARNLVERYFGDIPPGSTVNRVARMDSALRGEVRVTMHDKVQFPRLYLVWPSGPMFDQKEAPLDVLGTVLGDGKSSRLHRSLVYDKQIARDVSVGHYAQELAGEFHIQVTASPGHTLDEIQDVVEEELDRVRREPPTDEELARARNRIESQYVRELEQLGGFGGRADQLNYYNIMAKDPSLINSDLERYMAVEGEDVVDAANTALEANRVRLAVLPEPTMSSSVSSIDRSVMPKGSVSQQYTPPVPRRDRLANGLDLLFVEKPGLPIVAFGLVLRGGAAADPPGEPGLAHMTAAMLSEGTTTRSSQQIAEEMESLGTHLDGEARREYTVLSAETLTSHWPSALEIISDVVKNATFPPRELERVRSESLTDLKRIADDSAAIAQRVARALMYGPESSYGHPLSGTEQSVEAMKRDDLARHFDKRYGPKNATLVVVGDVNGDDVLSKAESFLGDWRQATSQPEEQLVGDANKGATTIFLADKPGAAQSVVRAGHLAITRHDPDYLPLNLVNYIFGGQPTARLFMNLRQDKGYSYGYYSTIDWLTGPSALFAGGAVETSVTKEAVGETLKEFADIRKERVITAAEFHAARDGISRGFPARFETQGQVANQLAHLVIFGLPDDYYSTFLTSLEAVTLDEVHQAAYKHIDDEHLTVLVVGDRKVVEPGLQELGIPVVLVDSEGRKV